MFEKRVGADGPNHDDKSRCNNTPDMQTGEEINAIYQDNTNLSNTTDKNRKF